MNQKKILPLEVPPPSSKEEMTRTRACVELPLFSKSVRLRVLSPPYKEGDS